MKTPRVQDAENNDSVVRKEHMNKMIKVVKEHTKAYDAGKATDHFVLNGLSTQDLRKVAEFLQSFYY